MLQDGLGSLAYQQASALSGLYHYNVAPVNRWTPMETLQSRKLNAENRIRSVQEELQSIEDAIKVLEENPLTAKVILVLHKVGII